MRARVAVTTLAVTAFAARPAAAYRPFDETDGDTAELDTVELEIGPTQLARSTGSGAATTGVPTGVWNYGFSDGFELVVDLDGHIPLAHAGSGRLDSDVLVKHVLREGVLQGASGPSIALEIGPLLPTVPQLDDEGGFSADLIISNRIGPITTHVNLFGEATRDRHVDGTLGTIVEAPTTWKLRPVGEIYYGNATGISVLAGAIWTWRKHVVFDGAVRYGDDDGHGFVEGRLGLTWVIDVGPARHRDPAER
jgi:hypothetical protein|nr:hypothetical protein [Kofleriaceae bacterium]